MKVVIETYEDGSVLEFIHHSAPMDCPVVPNLITLVLRKPDGSGKRLTHNIIAISPVPNQSESAAVGFV